MGGDFNGSVVSFCCGAEPQRICSNYNFDRLQNRRGKGGPEDPTSSRKRTRSDQSERVRFKYLCEPFCTVLAQVGSVPVRAALHGFDTGG